MKKIITLTAVLFLLQGVLHSQSNMSVPYGSFEQWTSHDGYNVTVMGMSLPVYESYSTPTGWDYLAYPVNETFSVYGSNVTINTTLPLVIATPETGAVPDGNKAVKLQTFMLSDIVSGLVYVIASSQLDPTLTQTVYPSILATGTPNLDSLLPLITTLIANSDNLVNMLTPLATRNVNDFISGGIALNGFLPSQLTGSYKYHSGESSDNGGVLMLGTRYNTSTHKREVVGGGINISLTDVNSYTPFTVDYQSLHELNASFADLAPDSLIVMLVSSASENRQQGSYLCVDYLQLTPDTTTTTVEEPDTCASVLNLEAVNMVYDAHPLYTLTWTGSSQPNHWEIEYGPQGFALGTGTVATTTVNEFAIYPLEGQGLLQPNTWYDFYVRSVCDNDIYGEWDSIHYRTFCAKVGGLTVIDDDISLNADRLLEGYQITWIDTTDTQHWMVEYGISGSSDVTSVEVIEPTFNMPPLQSETRYDVLVYALCGDDNYGEEQQISFTTATIAGIENADALSLSVSPNPANGRCLVTLPDNTSAELMLYGTDGRLIETIAYNGAPVEITLPLKGIYLLQVTTATGTATRKIVNK